MDVKPVLEILEKEFGIKTEKQLNEALSSLKGIDIGIFTKRKEKSGEKIRETIAC